MTKFIPIFLLALFSCTSPAKNPRDDRPEESTRKVSLADVEAGIRRHIKEKTNAGDGYYYFHNDTLNLNMKLVRVHTEYLSVLGPDRFFACVDLATKNGDVYDVDFFLEGNPGNMQVTRTNLHKLNGRPYYTWKQAEDETWFTVPMEKSSNRLLGVIKGTDEFTFQYEVEIPALSAPASIWVPIATSNRFQKVEIVSMKVPGTKEMILDDDNENRILYVHLKPEHSKSKLLIEYRVKRKEKSPYTEAGSDPEKYLGSSTYLPVNNRFARIADEIFRKKQATTPLTKARALYDHIIENMRYARQGVFGTGDAKYACDAMSGNCTEFHSYFISLARSAGIPARFAIGAAIPSERNTGGLTGYHCWAEFYAEGKWWPVDISEGNKYTDLATYYFGHHPANRILLSRGRDIYPKPGPKSGPINFFAYPILEVAGKKRAVETNFSFTRTITES